MVETAPFTEDGFKTLTEELQRLKKVERPMVIKEIATARAHGDLSENAEYHAAKERQGFIEARIADLDDKLSRAKVIDFSGEVLDQVRFGAYVTVSDENTGDERTFRIVGDLETQLYKDSISVNSPIARALLGKRVDDLIEVTVPKGKVEYLITEVRY